jgi:spermidine synthase
MDSDPDKWFHDKVTRNLIQLHSLRSVLYTGRTRFQTAEIIETGGLGRCLVLDGKIQSSEADEFVYHEALVQPPMITHPAPETVFIAGGGEGATLREVLRHRSVKRTVMVDIDKEVVDLCRQYLPGHSQGSFDDPRTELLHVDAREYLADSTERFDLMIIDLPDPIEEGPAYLLYTREFYQLVQDRLGEDSLMVVQSGPAGLMDLLNFASVHHTLQSIFNNVYPYQVDVPAFGGPWSFCLASRNLSPLDLTPDEVDARLADRGLTDLKLYDGQTHRGLFSLPRHLRIKMAGLARLITDTDPLYTYQA